jgi:hypothetical protein
VASWDPPEHLPELLELVIGGDNRMPPPIDG